MQDYLTLAPGQPGVQGDPDAWDGRDPYGFYDEEYALEPTGRRISFMRLTGLRIDPLTGGYIEHPPDDVSAVDTDWLER